LNRAAHVARIGALLIDRERAVVILFGADPAASREHCWILMCHSILSFTDES